MRKFIFLALILSLPAFAHNPFNRNYADDAMALAIEYFSPENEVEIKVNDEKHTFMRDLLQSTDEKFPLLTRIHKMPSREYFRYNIFPYGTLNFYLHTDKNESNEAYKKLQNYLNHALDLFSDCHYTKEIIEEQSTNIRDITTRWLFDFKFISYIENKLCSKSKAMFEAGVQSLEIIINERNDNDKALEIKFQTGLAHTEYVKKRLIAIPEFEEIAKELSVISPKDFFGLGSNITILSERLSDVSATQSNDTKAPSLSNVIQMQFNWGWGDCPAGCIYRHSWNLKITPRKPTQDEINRFYKYGFDIELISEAGDPVQIGTYLEGDY